MWQYISNYPRWKLEIMMKIFLLLALTFAAPAMAYPLSDTAPQFGFYTTSISSSAPVMIASGFWGRGEITPKEYVDKKCPGAEITEINMAGTPASGRTDTVVQIVFKMPQGGCLLSK